ncbi:MAG: helix-turn-helix domain-containing protein [Pseudonocardiaceae bacterium]
MGYHLLTEDTMPGSSPTVRRRQLAMELVRLRGQAGKTQQDAAEWLDIRDTGISKIETAKQLPSVAQLRSLFQLYQVGSPHADYLLQLRRESAQRGWWVEYGKTVPNWFADYIGMETAAAETWSYESEFIPGLLQIAEYTEAVSYALEPTDSPEEIQRIVRLRADRQRRLTSEEPLILRAVINEAALRRAVGGPEVMRAQLVHLAEVAKLPNVTVQVLAFSAGAHRGMPGSFAALRFPEESMNTVYLEIYGGALYVEDAPTVASYVEKFQALADQSLNKEETIKLIGTMIGSGP